MNFVLDCSVTRTWFFEHEANKETEHHATTTTLALGRRHKLSSYDAAYLELAMRLGLPLATLDKDLRKAAEAEGIAVLPTRIAK